MLTMLTNLNTIFFILEHSCINNASKHFDGDFRVVVRAAVNIKKGEHISINYSDPMWGTASRQLHLGRIQLADSYI